MNDTPLDWQPIAAMRDEQALPHMVAGVAA